MPWPWARPATLRALFGATALAVLLLAAPQPWAWEVAAPPAAPSEFPALGLAYLLQVSAESLPSLPLLLNALEHPRNLYAVHVDAKANISDAELNALRNRPNVRLMPRSPITYTGISMQLNALDGIDFLLEWSRAWTHFVLLSGADYPLVGQNGLAKALAAAPPNTSFVGVWSYSSQRWRAPSFDPAVLGLEGELKTFYGGNNTLVPPPERRIVVGPAWVILSRQLAAATVSGPSMRWVMAALAGTKDPEESAFQTFVEWTGTGGSVAQDNLRYVEHVPGKSHTRFLETKEQVDRAAETGAPFARKFKGRSPMLEYADWIRNNKGEEMAKRVRDRVGKAVKEMLAWKGGVG